MIPDWLTGFPYSVMHSLNLDWLLKKVASIDPSKCVQSVNNDFKPDPETGNLTLNASDVGALDKYGTANNSLLLDNKPSAYYLTPVNLLDNSNFITPVNQRGYVNDTIIENVYFIDRWNAAAAASFTFNDNGMTINASHCLQIVPMAALKTGQVYTLACKMNGNILCYSGQLENTIGSWEDGLVTIYNPGEGLFVYLTKTSTPYEWAALYEGDYTAETLPPYVPKPYAVELAECQRYYLPIITNPVGFGYAFSSGDVVFVNIPLPQPMRAIPTIPTGIVFTVKTVAGESLTSSSYAVFNMTGNALRLNISGVDIPAGQPCIVAATDFALNLDL